MRNWHDKTILVLGAGDTGVAVARYLRGLGSCVRVADSRRQPPGLERLHAIGCDVICGEFNDLLFGDAELVVTSPGVAIAGPACHPTISHAIASGKKFIGDLELFAWEQNEINMREKPKVIGITGSNGKSTVTAMTAAMCASAGLKTVVAGNIGLPVLDALRDVKDSVQPDVYVLELSSFQLETTSSLSLDAATMLNLSQDHLDRYTSMVDYAKAKQRIFLNAKHQIINRDDAQSVSMKMRVVCQQVLVLNEPINDMNFGLREGWLVRGNEKIIELVDAPITGLHNAANALAAFALVHAIGVNLKLAADGLRMFKGLPHRCQFIEEINGVTFLDDSKGTNVGSTVAALNGMNGPTVLIAGGEGKSQDFSLLIEPIRKCAKAVVLIGRDACEIELAVRSSGVICIHAASMDEAVEIAYLQSASGDTVLLSPACASFDMFRNYSHRGEVFANCVRIYKQRAESSLERHHA